MRETGTGTDAGGLEFDIADQSPVGITVCDPSQEGCPVVHANERFLELTGYDRSAVLGRNWLTLQGPATRVEAVETILEAVQSGESVTVDLRLYRADGDPFWDRVRVTPVTDGGEVSRYVGFHDDVTAERRHERRLEALHSVATRMQDDETVDAVCDRTVSAAADLLDFDLCSVVIRDGEWLVPRATSAETPPDGSRRMRIDQGLAGATYQTGESHVVDDVREDETSDPADETYLSGISIPVGEHGVFQAVQRETDGFDEDDIELAELLVTHTASAIGRIERERELERQNERLESFLDVVSHDLRNPLNVVSGALELCRKTDDRRQLDRAERAVRRMDQLVDDLLTLARHGQSVEDVTAVDLTRVARQSWQTVSTPSATLVARTDLVVSCHEGRCRQLLENLFRNAVEHATTTPGSGTHEDVVERSSTGAGSQAHPDAERGGADVTVTVGELPDRDGFYVADDGPGIPPAERESVFDEGYSSADDGTGLGLAIVSQIATAHGWEVSVTESESGGARFEIVGVDTVSSGMVSD